MWSIFRSFAAASGPVGRGFFDDCASKTGFGGNTTT